MTENTGSPISMTTASQSRVSYQVIMSYNSPSGGRRQFHTTYEESEKEYAELLVTQMREHGISAFMTKVTMEILDF